MVPPMTMSRKKPLLVALCVIVLQLLVSATIGYQLLLREKRYVRDYLLEELSFVEEALELHIREQALALGRMVARWQDKPDYYEVEWRKDAQKYVEDFLALKAIARLDSSRQLIWSEGKGFNEVQPIVEDLRFLERAVVAREPVYLMAGKARDYISIYLPLHSNEDFVGFLVAQMNIQDLLKSALSEEHLEEFVLNLSYAFPAEQSLVKEIDLGSEPWYLSLTAAESHFNEHLSYALPLIFMGLSLVLSVLMGVGAYLVVLLRQRTHSLADAKELHETLIREAVDGVILIDKRGVIRSFNPACETLFGYSAQEVIGQKINMLMPEPYRTEHDGYLKNYHQTNQAKIIGIGREVKAIDKLGRVFPIDLSVSKIALSDEILYAGVIRDITERKKVEEALVDASSEIEELSYRTSSDIRAPIVSSIHLIALALDAGDDIKMAQKSLLLAKSSLEKVETLVDSIISLMRAKNNEEEASVVLMGQLLDEVTKELQPMLHSDNVEIKRDLQFGGELVTWRSRMYLVLHHLMSNAIKYQDTHKEESYIIVRTFGDGKMFHMEVIDNGLGIPEDQQHRLFAMFVRFHAKIAAGSGLGLYLSKKCAELMHGDLTFQTRNGDSVFTYRFH